LTKQIKKSVIWFIVNPISGGKEKKTLQLKIAKHLDLNIYSYKIILTQYKGHAKEIAVKAVKEKIPFVCAVGGDGTIHEIGKELICSKTTLCIIPKGSGNGIANHLGLSKKTKKAIQCINEAIITKIDTVAVNSSFFIGTSGFGIDAMIARKFDNDPKRGFKTYIKHSIKEFINLKPMQIHIDSLGQRIKVEAFMLCIANTSEFGNRFRISPQSSVKDGMLELILVRPFPKWQGALVATQIFGKNAHKSKYIETMSVKEGKIELTENIAHYDGEFVNENKSISFKVLPASLKIVVPKNSLNNI
tara:strand:- start:1542 stop:2450 length:909 start_codon:yes stop_codon:yes gene_type:complete